jgi:hypothetical protein
MSEAKTIRVLTDAAPEPAGRHALAPLANVPGRSVGNVFELETNALAAEVGSCINSVQEMLAKASTNSTFSIETATFTVGINAAGQASLLAIASGQVGISTGLSFTLRVQDRNGTE